MSNHDNIVAAIRRLKQEVDKLNDDQIQEIKDATYFGTTSEQAKHIDARRQRITDLVLKIATLHREENPRTATLESDERERMQSLAKGIQEAPTQSKFNELVSELNALLAKRAA